MAGVGALAPDFKLQDENENWVSLKDQLARGPVMLAFYPGDFTPVCTQQLCSYQEAYDRFVQYGIQILGISGNSPDEHQRFKAEYRFAFHLLSDAGHETAKAYQIRSLFMLGGMSRAVFVIGKNGRVVYRYVEPTRLTHRNPGELLRALDELKASGKI